jgi:LysR family glycine cleavage system transcriptional activator
MPRKLPNLNAVKAFDAAARHQSFTLAADELCVTQAAVSRHIRLLERDLGVELFERQHRRVVLTTIGRRYAKVVEHALLSLALDTGGLLGAGQNTVVLDVDSDLAELWLRPQMSELALDRFDSILEVRAHPDPRRTIPPDVDLALTWGRIDAPGFTCEPFLDYTAFPVCAPELARGPTAPIREPADLLHHRLIHDRGYHWWGESLKRMGRQRQNGGGDVIFDRTYLCMHAAEQGLGVAIGDDVSSAVALRAGRLIRPCGPDVPGRIGYHLLFPSVDPLPAHLRDIIDWLRDLARQHSTWSAQWRGTADD